jgi:hypothetical protein
MKNLPTQIQSFLRSLIKLPIRVRNLKNWHSIVWKDHQKDYSKLLEIMEHKFCLQSEFWSLEGDERNARYNFICQNLAIRVRGEHYLNELIEHFNHGEIESYLKKHARHMKRMYRKVSLGIDQNGNLSDDEMTSLAMDIASYKHRKARRLLFKIMYHQLENWQS